MTTPKLVIIAGPNGSGKSTVTGDGRLRENGIVFPECYINADEIAKGLQDTEPNTPQMEREKKAFREARRLREDYRNHGESFAFETVFSHPSTLHDMIECRRAGFEVSLIFVCTADPHINVARVAGRVREGGHAVDPQKIEDRYRRTMRLLPRAIEEATYALVFDSTEEGSTRLCFRRRRYTVADALPEYLKTALVKPLAERETERETIATRFPASKTPIEAGGEYTGNIIWVGTHYIVQKTTTGSIRHDLLLFDAVPTDGETFSVRYKDFAATIEKSEK